MESSIFSAGVFFLETSGFSMWPFLRQGEKLIIKKTSPCDLSVGDIILYRTEKQLVCHRLVKKVRAKNECKLYARGDNSLSAPEFVSEGALQGKVIGVVKRNGRVTDISTLMPRLLNRIIVAIAPLVSCYLKPFYFMFRRSIKI